MQDFLLAYDRSDVRSRACRMEMTMSAHHGASQTFHRTSLVIQNKIALPS